jgi:hypothetical protein
MIRKSFFRQKALDNYQQSQVPKVMPKFVSSFVIFLFWGSFILLVGVAIEVWQYSPVHVEQGSGVLLNVAPKTLSDYGLTGQRSNSQKIGVLFFPSQLKTLLQMGNVVHVQLEGVHQSLSGSIERIDTTTQTVDAARSRYHLDKQALPNISSSIVVVLVDFNSSQVTAHYDQKRVTASVNVHIPNILHLFFTNLKLPGTG